MTQRGNDVTYSIYSSTVVVSIHANRVTAQGGKQALVSTLSSDVVVSHICI